MNDSINNLDINNLIDKLKQVLDSKRELSTTERDSLFKEILEALKTISEAPFGEKRNGYFQDFCAAYDDLGQPINDFLTSDKVSLTHQQKQHIVGMFIPRYFSHEPGGRTAIVKALVEQDASLIPQHIIEPLVKRASNATIDRTFLKPWNKHVELLETLMRAIARDNFELQGIIQLRLEELKYDDRQEIQTAAEQAIDQWQWLKIDPDKSATDFLKRWRFVLSLISETEIPLDTLLTFVEDNNPWVRSAAALVSGFNKNTLTTSRLLEHLAGDIDEYVRLRCAWAIGEIKDGAAFWRLIRLRELESIYCVRFAITDAIAQFDSSKAIELLLDDLGNDNPSIRLFGAEDIRKIRWPAETDFEPVRKVLSQLQNVEPLKSICRTARETLTWIITTTSPAQN
jgi:hypothetical protein